MFKTNLGTIPKFSRNVLLVIIAFLLSSCTDSKDSALDKIFENTPITKITDKVFVIHGSTDIPNKKNLGFMNNPGFVLTKKGVVIIDPGASHKIGKRVLDKIRAVTQDPVLAIFNTHAHGDHWLANGIIKQAFPKVIIYAHPKMKALAETGDGANWIKLFDRLTEGAMEETSPVNPDLAVDNEDVLKIGGIQFRIHHFGKAHTDGDLMIEVVEESVIFLGDMSLNGRIGLLGDGDFKGNVASLDKMIERKFKHYVPGHGSSGGVEIAKNYRTYLDTLYQSVSKLYGEGIPDYEMKPGIVKALAPYRSWLEFDNEVGRHISLVYLQVEQEAF